MHCNSYQFIIFSLLPNGVRKSCGGNGALILLRCYGVKQQVLLCSSRSRGQEVRQMWCEGVK